VCLWGPTCDGLDCVVKECLLPELATGDWMLFYDMGAYTMSAASTFNGMPKPKCYHIMNETQWIGLCRQSGLAIDLPLVKAGLDVSANMGVDCDNLSAAIQAIEVEA